MLRWFKCMLAGVLLIATPAFAEGHGPALWKIADGDTRIYIFGSVHALKPGTVWLSDDLRGKISAATAIYLEISAAEQQPAVAAGLLLKYGFVERGDSLKKHLPDKLYAELTAALVKQGVPRLAYDRFKPWTADLVYAAGKFTQAGYNPADGVEATIIGIAKTGHIPVEGLETAEYQITLFNALTDAQVTQMLEGDLAERNEIPDSLGRLTTSWTNGDLTDLAAYFDEEMAQSPDLRKKMLTDRNASWVPKIRALLGKPGDYLVVVGAAHLIGPDSLIALLRKSGVTVERVN